MLPPAEEALARRLGCFTKILTYPNMHRQLIVALFGRPGFDTTGDERDEGDELASHANPRVERILEG
eukprot:511511-Pyramimonas_sp.AAC.1